MRTLAFLGLLLLVAAGCDTAKVRQLEKENQELKADLLKKRSAESATADYDLQAKCSRDANGWFKENWSRDKDTQLLDYTNHYNKAQNKCFVFVEHHFLLGLNNGSWANNMTLWDVYENSKYGSFFESHLNNSLPNSDRVTICELLDNKCKTLDEFNGLVRPYFNN